MAGGGFNLETRQTFQLQNVINFTDSQPASIQIPQVGLLAKIRMLISGTTTTAAASSATRVAYNPAPMPYGIVRRVVLRSNEGTDIFSCTGYGTLINEYLQRTNFGHRLATADLQVAGAPQTVQSRIFDDGGDLGADETANWRFMLTIPIALGEQNLTGMLMAQNPGVNFTLEIQWGTTTDLYTVVGTVTLSNVRCQVETEFFHLPEMPEDDPDLGFVRRIIEEQQSITGTGDNQYTPPQGNIYLRFAHILENNSLPFSMALINQARIVYAQSQVAYNVLPDIQLYRQRERYGQNLPEAVYVWDWLYGNGLPENPSSRDAFDSGYLTDFRSIFNIDGSAVLTNARLRTIRDELVEVV
jgi:hypothetical protein